MGAGVGWVCGFPYPVSMEILLAACSHPHVPGGRAAMGVRWDALICGQCGFLVLLRFSEVPSLTPLPHRLPGTCLSSPSWCSLCWEGPLYVSPGPASPHGCPYHHSPSLGQPGHHFNASLALCPSVLYHSCGSLLPLSRFHTLPAIQGPS